MTIAKNGAGFSELFAREPDLVIAGLSLGNSGDYLSLLDDTGQEVDFVAWEEGAVGWELKATAGETLYRKDFIKDSDTQDDWLIGSEVTPGN
ncbi:MAG: hypothetical protein OMM_06120 [Candidatus Magnetoglobus multicellularis str. Araruama]|uniref:Uncharacterized protein n=1 Tax=Candidatus Magnetoglobus multicellularis str. Araruama TaxID=890399 RepID=A0A1V1NRG7_9BACT|nr:MAG: hypothetical protein OMM_06120 [Candidatus Magnetoglobus multicellularis str. Araruama]